MPASGAVRYTLPVHVHEFNDERLDRALSTHKAISRAQSPLELLAAFMRDTRRRIGFEYVVDLSTTGMEPGAYRVMFDSPLLDGDSDIVELAGRYLGAKIQHAPIYRGGTLASLIDGSRPVLVTGIDCAEVPQLGSVLGMFDACLAVPVFFDGGIGEWVLLFRCGDATVAAAEVHRLLDACNLLSRTLQDLELMADVERLNGELSGKIAELGDVQRSILPAETPLVPGLTVAVGYEPSDAAGGDYYDFRQLPDGSLGALIADVSGHGPAASVVMAMMRTIMAVTRAENRPTETVVTDVNRILGESLHRGMFVTALFLSVDPRTGAAHFANCGHPPPRLRRADGRVEAIPGDVAPPLGVLPDLEARGGNYALEPGDTLLLYTDGITESFDAGRRMFGVDGLDGVLAAGAEHPRELVDNIWSAVDHHRGDRRADDDRCAVALRFDGT